MKTKAILSLIAIMLVGTMVQAQSNHVYSDADKIKPVEQKFEKTLQDLPVYPSGASVYFPGFLLNYFEKSKVRICHSTYGCPSPTHDRNAIRRHELKPNVETEMWNTTKNKKAN